MTVFGMEFCIEMVIPLLCTGVPRYFFATGFGGGGGVTFTQGK